MIAFCGYAKQSVKVGESRLSHLGMLREHHAIGGEIEDAVLLRTEGALPVEEGCVSVAVPEIGYAGALSGDRSLHGREAEVKL